MSGLCIRLSGRLLLACVLLVSLHVGAALAPAPGFSPVSAAPSLASQPPRQLPYQPGELIVKLRPDVRLPTSDGVHVSELAMGPDVADLRRFLQDHRAQARKLALGRAGRERTQAQVALPAELDTIYLFEVPVDVDLSLLLYELRLNHKVLWAEPNYRMKAMAVSPPNDPRYLSGEQWNLERINLPSVWSLRPGSTVKVAVVDTGVDLDHPDLAPNLLAGAVFLSSPGFGCTVPGQPEDDDGHGTHVAGIVGAVTNNGTGIAGTGWNARILPVKVLDCGGEGTAADVASGIIWAVDQGAQIINLSLGEPASSVIASAVAYAASRGVLLVAAAGNDGTSAATYPAAYTEVISVAATTITDSRASYSNVHSTVELAAPGGTSGNPILSTLHGHTYGTKIGTSMAAPHIAGLAALAWAAYAAANPNATSSQVRDAVRSILQQSASQYPTRTSQLGYGLVDACKVFLLAAGVGADGCITYNQTRTGTIVSATPQAWAFGIDSPPAWARIAMTGTADGLDSHVALYQGSTLLTQDDNSGGGTNARILGYRLNTAGTYTIRASGTNGTTGSYSLSLTLATPVVPTPPVITTPISPTTSASITVTGTAEPLVYVALSIHATPLPTVTAGSDGSFSVANVPLAVGGNVLAARATNQYGETSSVSSPAFVVRVLTSSSSTPVPSPVVQTVSAGVAATITVPAAGVTVQFPSGALPATTQVYAVPVASDAVPTPPAGKVAPGTFISLDAIRTDTAEALTTFSTPVTITIGYDAARLGSVPASALAVHYFDSAASAWTPETSTVDTTARTVSANVTHFTFFTVLGQEPTPTPTPTPIPSPTPTSTPTPTPSPTPTPAPAASGSGSGGGGGSSGGGGGGSASGGSSPSTPAASPAASSTAALTATLSEPGYLAKGSGPEVYFIKAGTRYWVRDQQTLATLGGWQAVRAVEDSTLTALPRGMDLAGLQEGTAVKSPFTAIYIIRGGKRVWVRGLQDPIVYTLDWGLLLGQHVLPDEVLADIDALLQEGDLVRSWLPWQEPIYVIESGTKRHIQSLQTFVDRYGGWDRVQLLSPRQLASLPEGLPIP